MKFTLAPMCTAWRGVLEQKCGFSDIARPHLVDYGYIVARFI